MHVPERSGRCRTSATGSASVIGRSAADPPVLAEVFFRHERRPLEASTGTAMSKRQIRNEHTMPVPEQASSASGTCAIAHMRGGVTTVRAPATVRARRLPPAEPKIVRVAPTVPSDRFPVHPLGV